MSDEVATEAPAKARKANGAKAVKALKAASSKPKKAAPKVKAKPAKKAAPPAKKPAKAKAKVERTRDPAKLDNWGFRKGSIKSKAAAMYAGKKGATLGEVKDVVGSIQFNLINELETKGHKFTRTLVDGQGHRKATRYRLVA